jgi:hypothetical protein
MSRPFRIAFAYGLYHASSRGDGREGIYLDDGDRELYLEALADTVDRFNWVLHAFCATGNRTVVC